MRSGEYLLGKFLGNVLFLTTFLGGFMLSSMAMLIVRGEAPIEPLVFVEQYLLLTPAAIVFVSAVAVLVRIDPVPLRENWAMSSISFFGWRAVGLVVSEQASHHGVSWARYFDFTGFGFMIDQMSRTLHTDSVSIGASAFDPEKASIVFPGLTLTRAWVLPRLVSTLAPPLFLPLAALCFHRFDPARTKQTAEKSQRNWIGRVQNLVQAAEPANRRAAASPGAPGFVRRGDVERRRAHAHALSAGARRFRRDHDREPARASRQSSARRLRGAGDRHLGCGDARRAREHDRDAAGPRRACAKISFGGSSGRPCCSVSFSARVRSRARRRTGAHPLAALLVGIAFVAATATSLGVLTVNAKTFIVVFLSFWYLVVNDRGANPWLDFAGFYGNGNTRTMLLTRSSAQLRSSSPQGRQRMRLNAA